MKSPKSKKQNSLIAGCFGGGANDLVFWSFRYFLGRKTIAACCFARELVNAWPLLSPHTRKQIQKELDEAFLEDDKSRASLRPSYGHPLGHDCDRDAWDEVRKVYRNNKSQAK